MSPATSAFLDLLRLAAALVVLTNHCAQFWSHRIWTVANPLAHSAVVVFFVLSGYVIAYSTFDRNQDLRRYAVARLSRLYSVVLPALALTAVLQFAGSRLNPDFYAVHSRGFDAVRYVLTALFLQNVWTFSASPPTNLPFWSLCFEFWYYAAFGVAVFARERRRRWILLAVVVLIAGSQIILLSPCWILGVVLYVWRDRLPAPRSHRGVWFVASLGWMLFTIAVLPQWPFGLGQKGFWYSGAFLSDWLTALAVGFCIHCFDAMQAPAPPKPVREGIRYFADHTFSLYLYHYPLVLFATAVLPLGDSTVRQLLCAGGVLLVILLLSTFTEGKRDRWRAWIERGYDRLTASRPLPA